MKQVKILLVKFPDYNLKMLLMVISNKLKKKFNYKLILIAKYQKYKLILAN